MHIKRKGVENGVKGVGIGSTGVSVTLNAAICSSAAITPTGLTTKPSKVVVGLRGRVIKWTLMCASSAELN